MANQPTITGVVYETLGAEFQVTVTTTDGNAVQLSRSDDGGATWQVVHPYQAWSRTAGTHLLVDSFAPVVGDVLYRARVSDDGGQTWGQYAGMVGGTATLAKPYLRRADAPGMGMALFIPNDGDIEIAYTAERSKRWVRGATLPIVTSSLRRPDTVTVPGLLCFSTYERDELLALLNTNTTCQLALADGSLFWVSVDHNYPVTRQPGPADLWTLGVVFDVVRAP